MVLRSIAIRPAFLTVVLWSAASFAQIGFNLSSIARPGGTAPIPPELVQVYSASLNDAGDVAFGADNAVLLQSNGTTTIVAAFGDPSPGGGAFRYATSPSVNAQGQVTFAATGTQSQSNGIFRSTPDGIQPLVRVGDPAPGGGTFYSFNDVSTSADGGQLVFRAYARIGTRIRRGVFRSSGGTIRLLAYGDDPAPGGGTFRAFFSEVVNNNGQAAFYSSLNPSGRGIFLSQADGSLVAVARQGDPSPAGGKFDFSLASSWNRNRSALRDAAFRLERISGARRNSGGSLPSLDGGATFTFFDFPISINDSGNIAFGASTTLVGRGGVFVFSDGKLTRRIREGDPVPGGGTIDSVGGVSLNAAGQIAFLAYLSGNLIDHGLFLFSPDGTMTPIARFGDPSPEGDSFALLLSASLNGVGQVAFLSELGNSLGGAYLWTGGTFARVAGQGDPIKRDPKFINSYPLAIDRAGRVLFSADLFPGNYGLFLGNPTSVLARVGDPAPGGGVFDFLDSFGATAMNENGQAVFGGGNTSSTTSFTNGLYTPSDGMLSRIVSTQDPAPGGGTFVYFFSASINNSGDVAFGANASFPSPSGLFLFSKANVRNLVALGDPAPGGGTFSQLPLIALNDGPEVAFSSSVTPPGRPGIFRWSQGMVSGVAQSGDPAPGGNTFDFPFLANFYYPTLAPTLNDSGEVAFGAPLSNGDYGVFKFSAGELTSVARPGDRVPRAGMVIYADTASLNSAGQVCFLFIDETNNFDVGFFSQGTRSAVALGGDPAPGGGTLAWADTPVLNANMQVGLSGGLPEGSAVFLANPIR